MKKNGWIVFLVTFCLVMPAASVMSQETDTGTALLLAQADTQISDDELDEEMDDEMMDEFEQAEDSIADPLFVINYPMHYFNDFLYHAAVKPAAAGYKKVTPTVVRKGVDNFFHNLMFPVRFVNNVLQLEMSDAGKEVGIFAINTTIGVLGFAQVAQNHFDMHTADEDLGQTLGSYHIGNGFYLVIPVLGPSTLRDAVGSVGDAFLNPINYIDPSEISAGLTAYKTLNSTSFRLGDYEALTEAAIDPYVAIRDAYVQHRKKLVDE